MRHSPKDLEELALLLDKQGADALQKGKPTRAPYFAGACRWAIEQLQKKKIVDPGTMPTKPESQRIAALFKRSLTTKWAPKEIVAFRELLSRGILTEENLVTVETFYLAARSDPEAYLRTTLPAFLNNFDGEVDKAHNWLRRNPKALAKANGHAPQSSEVEPQGFREWFRVTYPRANPVHPFADIPEDIKKAYKL